MSPGRLGLVLRATLSLWAVAACGGGRPEAARAPSAARTDVVAPGMAIEQACVSTEPEHCFDARDDNCNGLIDEGCGTPSGLVHVAIAWDGRSADVDLDVTDPEGELASVGRATHGGLTKDRDCPGRNDECQGRNLENVFLEGKTPLRGRYQVRVRLERLGEAEPPIRIRLAARIGPKTYAAEIRLERDEEERTLAFVL